MLALGCNGGSSVPPAAGGKSATPPTPKPEPEPAAAVSDIDDASVVITQGPITPITPDQWVGRVQQYDQRKLGVHSADERVALARWAYEQGLEDEAWEQFAAVISQTGASAPDIDAYARRAMSVSSPGLGATVGANEEHVDAARVARIRDMGLAWSFTVAVQDDAPAEFFEDLQWRFRRMNWSLWRMTEGQMFLDELVLEDQLSDGRFVIEAGKLEATLLSGGGAFCANAGQPDWKVVSAGRVYTRVLVHEMLHGVFGLPDERHGCACIMQGGLYGIRSDQLPMCDDPTHHRAPDNEVSCWTIAQTRYPGLKHPSPEPWGAPPEPRFTVHDH